MHKLLESCSNWKSYTVTVQLEDIADLAVLLSIYWFVFPLKGHSVEYIGTYYVY